MEIIRIIKVAKDFSSTLGARDREDGDFSGEEFYENILDGAFAFCLQNKGILEINLDDTYGYPSSFISGSFGRLSKKHGKDVVLRHIRLISKEEPLLIEEVEEEIKNPKEKPKK